MIDDELAQGRSVATDPALGLRAVSGTVGELIARPQEIRARRDYHGRALTMPVFWKWLVAGGLATLTMDLASTSARKVGLVAGISPELMGRWFASLARGQFSHQTIAETAPIKGELPLAVLGHYCIGVSLTALFWVLVFRGPVRFTSAPSLVLAAVGFGVLSSALPWLWMFPSMGFGFFGLDGPPQSHLLRSSFLNHVFFGVGLALVTRLFGGLAR